MQTAAQSERFFTLANVTSLSRVPLAGVFWLTLRGRPEATWAPLTVMIIAGATDILDGKFAQSARNSDRSAPTSVRGTWLDPICDKIFVGVVLIALFVERALTVDLLVLIYARELIQIPTSLGYKFLPMFRARLQYDFSATVLGKLTTVLQFATIIALLFKAEATWHLAFASCLSGLLAAGNYLWRVVRIARRSPPVNRV